LARTAKARSAGADHRNSEAGITTMLDSLL
jgi:hypothetical protein